MKKTLLSFLLLEVWIGGAIAAVSDQAGEVTFLIGDVRITQGIDAGALLRRGSIVRPGQQIETGGSGQLHIRFIDGAAVAVRPMTRLRIEDYRYNPEQPSENRIRFFLDQGALRSITGKAGEAAKEKFRINTPVAAIGIRGTDFNVQTTQALTRASLFQGSIVLSPLGDQCSSATLGPCVGVNALELGETQREAFAVQARATEAFAQLVPKRLDPAKIPVGAAAAAAAEGMVGEFSSAKQQTNTQIASETVSATRAEQFVDTAPAARPSNPTDTPQTPGVAPTPQPETPVAPPTVPPPTIPPVVPVVTPPPIQLANEPNPQIWWGRWAAYADPSDAASYTRQRNPGRDEASGGNSVFGLLRTYSSRSQLPVGGGEASFSLARYEAYTVQGSVLTPATISSAGLTMNFDTRRFSTQLDVIPSGAGAMSLSAVGRLESDGRFYSDSGQPMVLSGGLANRAQQAGYAFERRIDVNTLLSGATAWTR